MSDVERLSVVVEAKAQVSGGHFVGGKQVPYKVETQGLMAEVVQCVDGALKAKGLDPSTYTISMGAMEIISKNPGRVRITATAYPKPAE